MSDYIPNGSKTCSEGIVKTLFMENTFTNLDCFIEIYQNSDDADSSKVEITIISFNDKKWLYINDNGMGMTMKNIDESLNLLSRSDTKKTHGKFNFGGKASMLFLSGITSYIQSENSDYNGDCIVLSKHIDDNPVCYSMNGSELIKKGWDGTIKPAYLNSDKESVLCKKFNEQFPFETGTSIFIELMNNIEEELIEGEQEIRNKLQLHCNERLVDCKLWVSLEGVDNGNILYEPIIPEIISEKIDSVDIYVYLADNEYIFTCKIDDKIMAKLIAK